MIQIGMRWWSVVAAMVATGLLGCAIDEPGSTPNSDRGHLFVELSDPLAVDWNAEVLVFGPSTGGQHCDDERGCYGDHRTLDVVDIVSTDPSVVSVEEFSVEPYGEVDVLRLTLNAVGDGEASLEFQFTVEGDDYPPEEHDEAAQSLQDEPDGQDDAGNDASPDSQTPKILTDSFDVEAREVSSIRLSRVLDDLEAQGPYGECTASGPGMYLMRGLDEYSVLMRFEKLDDRGNWLRGSGRFPFDIEPSNSVILEELDESEHLVVLTPRQYGEVAITPTQNGQPFEATFSSVAQISSIDIILHILSDHGGRIGESSRMVVDQFYELEVVPDLLADMPLCGGQLQTEVSSMTPAICEVAGVMETTGNPAVVAGHGGQCRLQVTVEGAAGGHGLVDDINYTVEYDW